LSASGFNRSDFGFFVATDEHALCAFCGHDERDRKILLNDGYQVASEPPVRVGVCEPCAYLAGWRWRGINDEVVAGPFPTGPTVVMVMIARPRMITSLTNIQTRLGGRSEGVSEFERKEIEISDPVTPFDVLMVTRKEEPSAFALPGGKVEEGEDPSAAAVRELEEETGLATWPAALEVLHEGFTARGKLARVYICRAYAGDAATREKGVNVEWKSGAPIDHAGYYKGFYRGVGVAFEMKTKTLEALGTSVPLCTRLGKAARSYIDMRASGASTTPDDCQLLSAYKLAMTEVEKSAVDFVRRGDKAKPAPPPEVEVEAIDDEDEGEIGFDEVDS